MDNQYSSFYLYRKYEVIGDELIDLGITSIDADGTQEPVMKEECDPECGCPPPEPIYRWVQTEDTVCIEVQYRWTESGTTCIGYDKYQNNIKEESIDGVNWSVVIPEEYSASTLIQRNSEDCGYIPPFEGKYRLVLNDSTVVTAACDSSSAVTSGISNQYRTTVVNTEIGNCVSSIDQDTFYLCYSLTSVTIPESVTTIGNRAFGECSGLTSVILPTGLTSIGDTAFAECTNLTSITISDSVTNIGEFAFYLCTHITDINIPSGITRINDSAFSACFSLTSITIPSSVEQINRFAFYGCTGLTSVIINRGTPPTLGDYPFYDTNNCPIYVPCASVDTYKAASGWSDLASRIEGIPPCGQPTPASPKFTLTLSDSSIVTAECDSTSAVTSGEVATQYSGTVVSAEIGDCVASINSRAFYHCSSLTSVTIPNSVTTIGSQAFRDCSSFSNITIPNSVTTIGSRAFDECTSLTTVDIPSSVTSIGVAAFYHCSSLTSITIPDSVTTIGNQAFMSCTSLASCTIPSGVTSIGDGTFGHCIGLTSINMPNSVTSIGDGAFDSCYILTTIYISNSVTDIGYSAFRNCSGLTSVTINATTPPSLGYYALENTNNCPIYVPSGSVDAYKAASGWSSYSSRIQAIP